MLRVVAHKSAAAALSYYTQGLRREDYYSEGQEVIGNWHGRAAQELGLSGKVMSEEFAALVENRHPATGAKLTARMNKSDRVVGHDFNFHAPKSLSLLHAFTGDDRILQAFRSAVAQTMAGIEAQAETRVRKRGAQENRITGNLAWAEFIHLTARPVGGIPDPHLHIHAFVFNATLDPEEGRWKAVKFRNLKRDAPYSEAVFHARLTQKLKELGYGIERTRQGWEVQGVPRTLIDKFSRRTAQIERLAAEKGISDAQGKDGLGAASRENKRHGLTHSDLLAAWGVRLTPEEKALLSKLGLDREPGSAPAPKTVITPKQAFDDACEKLFAKSSVVEAKRLVAEALRFGVGQVSPERAWAEFDRRGMVVREEKGQMLCTSLDVLAEEVSLIHFVRTGRGMHAPLALAGKDAAVRPPSPREGHPALSAEQEAAVRHLLSSRDQVMAIRGGAGVGKTTLMREAVAQIEAGGCRVFAFAPSASASRETLREAGFGNAETVAHLLANPKLQEETRGQVIWVDEAGLLGVKDLWAIMQIAGDSTRVILTGDTAQHAPVARGDAFRLLQQYAGLNVAEVTQIRRQEEEGYRRAVAALSRGDLRTAFRRLDELGAILEVENDSERYRLLAQDYAASSRSGAPPLVVSPTHAEGAKVTAAIREAKREAGLLKGAEKSFTQLHNLQWEEPDRRRAENYQQVGLLVQFHQNATGIRRGELLRVRGYNEQGEVLAVNEAGEEVPLPLKDAARFQVFEERAINLARGDRIRITRNGKSEDGRRLNNGNVFAVNKLTKDGRIVLETGAVLDGSRPLHVAYGYGSTSHSSQSKSVREVLVAQSADSFLASSREQFYVSVSRGKASIRIYTDDRAGLQEAVGNSSLRKAGVELAGLSSREVATLMSAGELSGRQWHEQVQTRRAEGTARTHVATLLKERRQEGLAKPASMDFRQYVAMRRGLSGSDGKSRSKGHPTPLDQKKGNVQARGRSFLRPTELTTATKEKLTAAKSQNAQKTEGAQKQPAAGTAATQILAQGRQNRAANAYQAGRAHFGKVAGRVKGALQTLDHARKTKALPPSNVAQASRHSLKQRSADAGVKAKAPAKVPQKVPTPAPVARRGR